MISGKFKQALSWCVNIPLSPRRLPLIVIFCKYLTRFKCLSIPLTTCNNPIFSLQPVACRQLSASLLTDVDKSAHNCRQACCRLSASNSLPVTVTSYQALASNYRLSGLSFDEACCSIRYFLLKKIASSDYFPYLSFFILK